MQAVARAFALSSRTLQRQLKSENVTFQCVLNETREALAQHYLAQGRLTVAEIGQSQQVSATPARGLVTVS